MKFKYEYYWILAGLLFPLIFIMIMLLMKVFDHPFSFGPGLILLLWPTSIILMALETVKGYFFSAIVYVISISTNMALYYAIGAFLRMILSGPQKK